MYKKTHYLTFDIDRKVKVTLNVTQFLLYYGTYVPAKFEVGMPNGLGGDAFPRKHIL